MICDRTEKENFRYERMQGILISAMLQSQQVWLPVLHQPIGFGSCYDKKMSIQSSNALLHIACPNKNKACRS
jgi:RNA methyltransferase.